MFDFLREFKKIEIWYRRVLCFAILKKNVFVIGMLFQEEIYWKMICLWLDLFTIKTSTDKLIGYYCDPSWNDTLKVRM